MERQNHFSDASAQDTTLAKQQTMLWGITLPVTLSPMDDKKPMACKTAKLTGVCMHGVT